MPFACQKYLTLLSRFGNTVCEYVYGSGITDCTYLWSYLFNHKVALVKNWPPSIEVKCNENNFSQLLPITPDVTPMRSY